MQDVRRFPEQQPRVESGPIQFGDDWPGVWIRGDNALAFANMLEQGLKHTPPEQAFILRKVIEGLISDLRSCSVGNTGWPP